MGGTVRSTTNTAEQFSAFGFISVLSKNTAIVIVSAGLVAGDDVGASVVGAAVAGVVAALVGALGDSLGPGDGVHAVRASTATARTERRTVALMTPPTNVEGSL